MTRLNKTTVDSLEPGEPDYFVWDDLLPGFGLRVWPSGKKVYLVQYRVGRKQRRVKVGTHGPMTAEEARKQAKIILGDVARGEDPQEEKQTRRKSITVAELCDEYMLAAEKGLIFGKDGGPKKPTTLRNDRSRIAQHINPLLGQKLVVDVTRADVIAFVVCGNNNKNLHSIMSRCYACPCPFKTLTTVRMIISRSSRKDMFSM